MSDDDVVLLESPPRVHSIRAWIEQQRRQEQEARLEQERLDFKKRFYLIRKPICNDLSHEQRSQQLLIYIQKFPHASPPEDTRKAIFSRAKLVYGQKKGSIQHEDCAICGAEGPTLTLTCACRTPLYHADCLMEWAKKSIQRDSITCPTCRQFVKPLHIEWVLPNKPLLDRQHQKKKERRKRQRKEVKIKKEKERLRQMQRVRHGAKEAKGVEGKEAKGVAATI